MIQHLLVAVRLHEGWYHGARNTPSPARMFQALVAGAGVSGPLNEAVVKSLCWLERQEPPIVGTPYTTNGQSVVSYVPNNDLDAKQGDYRKIGAIRTKKVIAPLLFDSEVPFLYAWKVTDDADRELAETVRELADRVYQLGRTVDAAWAWGELVSGEELEDRLNSYPGIVQHPSAGPGDVDCPTLGSLTSLHRRYQAAAEQFDWTADGKGQTFRRRPKPKWKKVSYGTVGTRYVLELRRADDMGFSPWPLERAAQLVELLRDGAAERLRDALNSRIPEINRTLIGRGPNGQNDGPTSARIRIIPLPSIGHPQADMQIRRVLVEVPGECPIRPDDIAWAFSGLRLAHPVLNEPIDFTHSSDQSQLEHYGLGKPSRIWRSVTPVALPDAARRRIDPKRQHAEAKPGTERHAEQFNASFAFAQALRHAGVGTLVNSVRVQREPFDLRGTRVESFAEGTRFNKHSLWHVEVEFDHPLSGPLLLGNGRFLGLGLLKPVQPRTGIFAFSVESGLTANPDSCRLARSLRRSVMARARDEFKTTRIPAYFSGHHQDGSPANSEDEPHLAFLFDEQNKHFFVITPEHLHKQSARWAYRGLARLETILNGFHELRAGRDGDLRIRQVPVDVSRHHLFAPSCVWESLTPYTANRHAHHSTADAILRNDVILECERRGLPRPEVAVLNWHAERGVGLQGNLCLTFRQAIDGPIILGKTRHMGGGVFKSIMPTA